MFVLPGEPIKISCKNTSIGIKYREPPHKNGAGIQVSQKAQNKIEEPKTNTSAETEASKYGKYLYRSTAENSRSMMVSSALGELLSLDKSNYWINYKQCKYVPSLDDIVLGVIRGKGKDTFKVDIGSCSSVIINCLDFPAATKRNRTNLSVGDVILAQVIDDSPHSEAVISCKTEAVKGMGPLKDGVIIKVGILQARKYLLHPPVLNISAISVFSMNGYAWVSPGTQQNIRKILSII